MKDKIIEICVSEIAGNGKYELAEQLQQTYDELISELANRSTLNRDKVKGIVIQLLNAFNWEDSHKYRSDLVNAKVDAICSLSLPTLSEGEWTELRERFFEECTSEYTPKDVLGDPLGRTMKTLNMAPHDMFEWFKAALKEQTQPKEE